MGAWGILLLTLAVIGAALALWYAVLPLCRYALAWITVQVESLVAASEAARKSAIAKKMHRESRYSWLISKLQHEIRRMTAQATAEADPDVLEAWRDAEKQVAAATAKERIAAAKRRYGRRGGRIPSNIRELFWNVVYWGTWVVIGVMVVGLFVFGGYKLNEYNTSDHYASVIVCHVDGSSSGNPPTVKTSDGTFTLDPGWYGPTYYADKDKAAAYFRAGQAVKITYHGGHMMDRYINAAQEVETGGKTCAS